MTSTSGTLLSIALRVGLVLTLGGVVGLLFGHPLAGLLLGSLGMLAWQLRQQLRLYAWLRDSRSLHPPVSVGLWGDIFNAIYRMQVRQRRRGQRLAAILQAGRQTINATPDGAVILQLNGEIRWWNARARDLLGLRWPQDEGQRIDNLVRHPAFVSFLDREARLVSAGAEASSVTVPSPLDDSIMLEIRIIPYGDGQGLLLARDISRIHRLELVRRDFVANVSHELRTPLTVIRGMAESLHAQIAGQAPELERPFRLIEEQSERMQRLVEDLLLLSRLETGQNEPSGQIVPMAAVLRSVVDGAQPLIEAGQHTVTLDIDDRLALRGDERELRSLCSNLIFNAIKYTPDPGTIAIRWQRDGEGASLSVSDTGIGIAPVHIPRLTERFYRVDVGRSRATGGTGLGLAIVKHVLSRYGSRLAVQSSPGRGSRFSCVFPASRIAAVPAEDADRDWH